MGKYSPLLCHFYILPILQKRKLRSKRKSNTAETLQQISWRETGPENSLFGILFREFLFGLAPREKSQASGGTEWWLSVNTVL